MDPKLRALVHALHASPYQAVIFTTGGAASCVSDLLSVPGASNTLLEATVPYSRESQKDLLGHDPDQFVSAAHARDLAHVAYRRAAQLAPPGVPVVGVGAACALASEPPKRGEHRCEVAAVSSEKVWQYRLNLAKGARDRFEEERLASLLLLQVLVDAFQVDANVQELWEPLLLLGSGDQGGALDELRRDPPVTLPAPLDHLYSHTESMVEFSASGVRRGATRARLILPGSFNPLHQGHMDMLRSAQPVCPDKQPAFEISVQNADKGFTPKDQIEARLSQFLAAESPPCICTTCPLYVDKARLLPKSTFVIGMDTAIRLVNPKYYGNTEAGMVSALAEIRALGCDFLVAGRLIGHDFVDDLSKLDAPPCLMDMFRMMPEFRRDISSTELRSKR